MFAVNHFKLVRFVTGITYKYSVVLLIVVAPCLILTLNF